MEARLLEKCDSCFRHLIKLAGKEMYLRFTASLLSAIKWSRQATESIYKLLQPTEKILQGERERERSIRGGLVTWVSSSCT